MIAITLSILMLAAGIALSKTRKLAFATTRISRENPEMTSKFANSEDIERLFGKK